MYCNCVDLTFRCLNRIFLVCCFWFRCSGTGKRYSNRKETSCLPLLNAGFELKVSRHLFASRLNACWQTDWAIEDQAKKLELDSPSLWSASIQPTRPHSQLAFAPGSGDIHVCCCWFRCSGTGKRYSNRKETSFLTLLNAGFEPKVSDTYSPADWMHADKPTELSRIKLKKLELDSPSLWSASISPLDLTASWLSHLALAIYMFVVVDFDDLAEASDIRIGRRQVVFLCWMQDSNPRSQTPIRQQTEWLLTNWQSYRGSS